MENASKALLIAGGILLAMLTASLLMLLNNNIQSVENAKSEKIAQEQRTAFNREYEAYNKKIMYGTDVITVVNKAIDNNIIMNNVDNPDNAYYVNVVFKVKDKFTGEEQWSYDDYRDHPDWTSTSTSRITSYVKEDITSAKLTENREYTLGSIRKSSAGKKFEFKDEIKGLFVDNTAKAEITNYPVGSYNPYKLDDFKGKATKVYYSPLVQFKKAIFTCKEIKYDNRSGRVNEISFEQVKEK